MNSWAVDKLEQSGIRIEIVLSEAKSLRQELFKVPYVNRQTNSKIDLFLDHLNWVINHYENEAQRKQKEEELALLKQKAERRKLLRYLKRKSKRRN